MQNLKILQRNRLRPEPKGKLPNYTKNFQTYSDYINEIVKNKVQWSFQFSKFHNQAESKQKIGSISSLKKQNINKLNNSVSRLLFDKDTSSSRGKTNQNSKQTYSKEVLAQQSMRQMQRQKQNQKFNKKKFKIILPQNNNDQSQLQTQKQETYQRFTASQRQQQHYILNKKRNKQYEKHPYSCQNDVIVSTHNEKLYSALKILQDSCARLLRYNETKIKPDHKIRIRQKDMSLQSIKQLRDKHKIYEYPPIFTNRTNKSKRKMHKKEFSQPSLLLKNISLTQNDYDNINSKTKRYMIQNNGHLASGVQKLLFNHVNTTRLPNINYTQRQQQIINENRYKYQNKSDNSVFPQKIPRGYPLKISTSRQNKENHDLDICAYKNSNQPLKGSKIRHIVALGRKQVLKRRGSNEIIQDMSKIVR